MPTEYNPQDIATSDHDCPGIHGNPVRQLFNAAFPELAASLNPIDPNVITLRVDGEIREVRKVLFDGQPDVMWAVVRGHAAYPFLSREDAVDNAQLDLDDHPALFRWVPEAI